MAPSSEQIQEKYPAMLATPEDADQIRRLIRDSWVKNIGEVLGVAPERLEELFEPSMSDEGLKKRKGDLAHPPKGMYTFVAKEGTKVVGVCIVQRQANESGENELASLHVAPGRMGLGIGRSLWKKAEKELDSAKNTFLWTTVGTKAAEVVYPGWEFEPVEYGTELLKIKEPVERPIVKMLKKAKTSDTISG